MKKHPANGKAREIEWLLLFAFKRRVSQKKNINNKDGFLKGITKEFYNLIYDSKASNYFFKSFTSFIYFEYKILLLL